MKRQGRRMTLFEAAIFDWDGTLADTMPVVVFAFQKVLRGIDCVVSDDFLIRRVGIGARNMFKDALKLNNIAFDEAMVDDLMDKKFRIQTKRFSEVRLFDGATELLDSLRPKLKIGLATMSNRPVINKLLRMKGLDGYFDFVLSADEVKHPKPDPEIFVNCAHKLDCKPERCVVFEDSVFGVIAAKSAKMKCVAIPSGAYTKAELIKEKPDLVVDSLKETQRILDFVFSRNQKP
jgi:HAD superfamily hydrolase (TIGR01509 family)